MICRYSIAKKNPGQEDFPQGQAWLPYALRQKAPAGGKIVPFLGTLW